MVALVVVNMVIGGDDFSSGTISVAFQSPLFSVIPTISQGTKRSISLI
jgi:hypothetical protein